MIFWRKAFSFIRFFILQNVIFTILFVLLDIFSKYSMEYLLNNKYLIVCNYSLSFFYGIGINGLLLFVTSAIPFFFKKITRIIVGDFIIVLMYLYLLEYLLDIYGLFNLLLFPTLIGVYLGTFLLYNKDDLI